MPVNIRQASSNCTLHFQLVAFQSDGSYSTPQIDSTSQSGTDCLPAPIPVHTADETDVKSS
jgi:hypothetical protein